MAKKKVGELIREARTNAGLSQEALAKMIDGLSASELGKAERGEKDLTQAELKAIAKATGVTQKSLLEAPKGGVSSTAAKKTEPSKKTDTAKKTGTSASKKTASTEKKSAGEELTSAEKTLLAAWRKADADTKKAALALLKGEKSDDDLLSTLLTGAFDMLGNLGKK